MVTYYNIVCNINFQLIELSHVLLIITICSFYTTVISGVDTFIYFTNEVEDIDNLNNITFCVIVAETLIYL